MRVEVGWAMREFLGLLSSTSLNGLWSFGAKHPNSSLSSPPPPHKPHPSLTPSLSHTHRPHTLPPTTLYLAHLAPYLASTHTQLMAQLAETQAENEALARRIDAQRKEADGLLQGLERVVRDLEVANGVLGEHVGEVERDGGAEERAELGGR